MIDPATAQQPLLSEWSEVLTTRRGGRLFVRPSNPEDRLLVESFLAALTQDDLRFRFLSPIARPGQALLDTLVNVDHVRTEDFLAFAGEGRNKVLVASAMLAADPALERAEVAIAVRPDYRQHGVGWSLLDFVARDAAARGIRSLESVECRDNRAAIDLEREMGFTASSYPGDPTLTLVRKTLGPATEPEA
jgi:GNAT superfamily N-acetyltransferase